MINNKTFNAANVAAIFELPNIFALNFHFLILLFAFWAVLRSKNYNFAVQNFVRHLVLQQSCQNCCCNKLF